MRCSTRWSGASLHGERALLEVASDPLVHRLDADGASGRAATCTRCTPSCASAQSTTDGGERFVAWFEPEHFILEADAPTSSSTASARMRLVDPDADRLAALGPRDARRRPAGAARAMRPTATRSRPAGAAITRAPSTRRASTRPRCAQHMPKKYWHNLPETQAIPGADRRPRPSRVQEMIEQEAAMPTKRDPEKAVAAMARAGAEDARRAQPHHRRVRAAGAGRDARRAGRRADAAPPSPSSASSRATRRTCRAGRSSARPGSCSTGRWTRPASTAPSVYVTNAVKHFKFEQRGKRRMHQKPTAGEVKHYRWWLMKELELVQPEAGRGAGRHRRAGAGRQGAAGHAARAARPSSASCPATSPCTRPICCACPTRRRRRRPIAAFVADLRAARKLAA